MTFPLKIPAFAKMFDMNLKSANIEDIRDILQFNKDSNEFIRRKVHEDQWPTVATFVFDTKFKEIQIYSYYDGKVIKLNME